MVCVTRNGKFQIRSHSACATVVSRCGVRYLKLMHSGSESRRAVVLSPHAGDGLQSCGLYVLVGAPCSTENAVEQLIYVIARVQTVTGR